MTRNLKKYFEDLIDDLSMDTDDRYKQYLRENPRTFVYENLIFDVEHLDSYYDCNGCKERKPGAFCCSGYDVELTGRDLEILDRVVPELVQRYPRLGRVLEGGRCWRHGDNFERVMRRKSNDDCIFLMPGGKGCYLHAFAVSRGIEPMELKPYICSLYPVVVVIIGEEIVITTLNEESKQILETGDDACSCGLRRGRKDNHTLVRSREILARMFGDRVCEELIKHVFGENMPARLAR